jgi:hypothetical protein
VSAPRGVRFGIFDWMDDSGAGLAEMYEQRLKLVELADRGDFYAYHQAEHHGTPLGLAPSPNVFLAAAAARTRRLRLGTLVNVVPLYDPVRLVEEICMLDHLSRGIARRAGALRRRRRGFESHLSRGVRRDPRRAAQRPLRPRGSLLQAQGR